MTTSKSWYRQSTRDQDTHRGYVYRFRVHTLCGHQFNAYGRALTGEPRDPSQICPPCPQAYRAEQVALAQRTTADLVGARYSATPLTWGDASPVRSA